MVYEIRDHNLLKYKTTNINQFRLQDIKTIISKTPLDVILSKENFISLLIKSKKFSSERIIDDNARALRYFGIIKDSKKEIELTDYGRLSKFAIQYKSDNILLNILNYSAYKTNYAYHMILEILFKILEQERTGSASYFSKSNNKTQLSTIKNKIYDVLHIQILDRQLYRLTHFLRELNILEQGGYLPIPKNHVWRGIFLLSLSDVINYHFNGKEEFLISEQIIDEIRCPLFLSRSGCYSLLSRETVHPYFKLNKAKGNEQYIRIDKLVTPIIIMEENL